MWYDGELTRTPGVCCDCSKCVSSFFHPNTAAENSTHNESCRTLKERPALVHSFERSGSVRSLDAAPAAFGTVGDRTPGWGWLRNQKTEEEVADPSIPFKGAFPMT